MNLQDIIYKQKGFECVVASYVNGIVSLKDNHFVKQYSKKKNLLNKMKNLILEIYSKVYAEKDINILFPITYLEKSISKIDELKSYKIYSLNNLNQNNITDFKQLLNQRKIFVSLPDINKSDDHQYCLFYYENDLFHIKDSFGYFLQAKEEKIIPFINKQDRMDVKLVSNTNYIDLISLII